MGGLSPFPSHVYPEYKTPSKQHENHQLPILGVITGLPRPYHNICARASIRAPASVARIATPAAGMLRATRAVDVLSLRRAPGGPPEQKKSDTRHAWMYARKLLDRVRLAAIKFLSPATANVKRCFIFFSSPPPAKKTRATLNILFTCGTKSVARNTPSGACHAKPQFIPSQMLRQTNSATAVN